MKCFKCGFEETDSVPFCQKCGAPMQQEARLQVEAAQEKQSVFQNKLIWIPIGMMILGLAIVIFALVPPKNGLQTGMAPTMIAAASGNETASGSAGTFEPALPDNVITAQEEKEILALMESVPSSATDRLFSTKESFEDWKICAAMMSVTSDEREGDWTDAEMAEAEKQWRIRHDRVVDDDMNVNVHFSTIPMPAIDKHGKQLFGQGFHVSKNFEAMLWQNSYEYSAPIDAFIEGNDRAVGSTMNEGNIFQFDQCSREGDLYFYDTYALGYFTSGGCYVIDCFDKDGNTIHPVEPTDKHAEQTVQAYMAENHELLRKYRFVLERENGRFIITGLEILQ